MTLRAKYGNERTERRVNGEKGQWMAVKASQVGGEIHGEEERFTVPDRKGDFPWAIRRTEQAPEAPNSCREEA